MTGFVQKRLEVKIIVTLVFVLGLVIGVFTVIDIRIMRIETMHLAEQNLRALASIVKDSVVAEMRRGYHEEVQRIIEEARASFDIDSIVIYDERGKPMRGTGIDKGKDDPNLRMSPDILRRISAGDRTDIRKLRGNYYLSYYSPIANQPSCFRCHPGKNALNGILHINFSLHEVEPLIAARRNSILIWTLVMIASLMTALVVLLRHFVHKPVEELRNAMARAEAGNEDTLLPAKGSDELSELKRGFVGMMDRINALHRANLEKEKELARSHEIMRFRAELQTMFDAMPDGVLLIDTNMRIVQSNPRVYALLPGIEHVGGKIKPADVLPKDCCPFQNVEEALNKRKTITSYCSINLPDGETRHLHSICSPILEDGKIEYIVAVIRDITERVRTERELEQKTGELIAANRLLSQIAITDSLTRVHNRRHFDELLSKEIKRYKRRKYAHLSLMMIDIDHFKELNDRYGHLAGDAVLREIATMLRENVRETDTVARYGGEEFVIVMPETHLDGAAYRAEALRKKIEARVIPGYEQPITTTVSIGVAGYVSGSPKDLVKIADEALYQAKNAGRNKVFVNRPEAGLKG